MENKINPELIIELKKIHKLTDTFLQLAITDCLISDYTIKRYLVRHHYWNRKKEIHRKGYDSKGNNKSTVIARQLAEKYEVSEQTVWNYLR
jgi:hypothetical protein